MPVSYPEESKNSSWEAMLLSAAEEISLSESLYKTIQDRYEVLKKVLDTSENPLLKGSHIFIQGSIGLRTAIKPSSSANSTDLKTVDADAVVLLPNAQHASAIEVLNAIKERFDEGSRTATPIEELKRGIRIIYADEDPGFHIDLTPARAVPENNNDSGYGKLKVPDRELQDWKCSSPRDYSQWLENTASKTIKISFSAESHRVEAFDSATQDPLPHYNDYVSGTVLQAVIKLLKRHRDECGESVECIGSAQVTDVGEDGEHHRRKGKQATCD